VDGPEEMKRVTVVLLGSSTGLPAVGSWLVTVPLGRDDVVSAFHATL
jgi:hypothetical protein